MRKGVRPSTLPPSGRRKSFLCGVLYVVNYFIVLNAVTAGGRSSFGGELTKLNVLAGGVIELNCSRSDDETPFLVVWYKGEEPIYSYDARDIEKTATNWSHREYFGQRASLGQYAALIHIDPVILEDTGEYRCRVDFRNIPTRNAKFLLTVIVPPEHPEIYDSEGKQLQKTAGPYLEGLSVRLTCIVRGGVPPPSIVWYQGVDRINSIDISSNYALAEKTKAEQISILDLNRKDRGTSYSCHCNHPSQNVKETVIIDMYLRTERVEIFKDLTPFSSGRRHEVKCQAEGSIPPPTISWFIGEKHLTDFIQTDSDDGNSSISTLFYTPTKIDDGKVLTCRAHNNYIPKEFKDDKMTLDVYYAPIMKLKLGMQMNPLDIEATDDVYFECMITSNPNAYKVIWKHNGQILQHSSRLGIITSNTHLALQTVNRHQAGNYTCTASNVEGDGVSNIVDLKVMYKPMCMDSQKKLYGLAKGEKAVISCMVDSYPAPSAYRWAFNNTAETRDLTDPPLEIQEKPYTSVLSYTPLSENDYGTVLCWAVNVPGRQREPCVFHIIPGGKPDPPYNCTLLNQTVESLDVECFGGFDGGQEQIFVMEVYDQKAQLQSNVSSVVPRFMVSGLKPGMELYLDIFAANRRGRSEKANLEYLMLRSPEIQTTEVSKPVDFKLVSGILFGILVTLVIMVAVVVYAMKASRKSGEVDEDFSPPVHGHAMKEKGTFPHACSETESVYGDKNPDVIRFNKGTFHREPAFPESDYQAETNLSVLNMEEWHLPSPLSIATHLPPPPHQVSADPQSLQFGDLRIKHPQYDYLMETQNGKMVGAVYGHTDYPVCLDSAVSIRPVREVVTVRTPLMFNQQQESCV